MSEKNLNWLFGAHAVLPVPWPWLLFALLGPGSPEPSIPRSWVSFAHTVIFSTSLYCLASLPAFESRYMAPSRHSLPLTTQRDWILASTAAHAPCLCWGPSCRAGDTLAVSCSVNCSDLKTRHSILQGSGQPQCQV